MFQQCESVIEQFDSSVQYEIFIHLGLMSQGKEKELYFTRAMAISKERAEPYYYWALHCMKNNEKDMAYKLLSMAYKLAYTVAREKYGFVQRTAYDKYLLKDLREVCPVEMKEFYLEDN